MVLQSFTTKLSAEVINIALENYYTLREALDGLSTIGLVGKVKHLLDYNKNPQLLRLGIFYLD
jgi:hypothetical protein